MMKQNVEFCFMEYEQLESLILRNYNGQRKYLNQIERKRFLANAAKLPPDKKAFCRVLHYTGCRISEALALTPYSIDLSEGVILIETLKRRRKAVFRVVPVPKALLLELSQLSSEEGFFDFSRTTAWRVVKEVMKQSAIEGTQATTKGLRHGFGVAHATQKTPLNLIQRWLGHASSDTTKIYLDAVGKEERDFAKRLW